MAFKVERLLQAEGLQGLGFVAFFGGQAAVVGDTIAGILPDGSAAVGALLILAGAVMKFMNR